MDLETDSRAGSSRARLTLLSLWLSSLVPLACLVVVFWPYTVDDTFITLRYARNWGQGLGLTWNPGEPPVEGYTSFLWTLLLVPAHWFTDDAEWVAKLGGTWATLLTWIVTATLAAGLTKSRGAPFGAACIVFSALWLGLQLGPAVHAVSGMDTALFTLLLITTSWSNVRVLEVPSTGRSLAFALVGLLTGLTRPEGNLAFVIAAVVTFSYLAPDARRRYALCLSLGYLAPAASYFAWRLGYYELLFPLPFYVKAVGGGEYWAGASEAWAFVRKISLESPFFGVLLVIGAVAAPRALRPSLWAALGLFLFFLKPAPLMAYNHRYLHPLLPLLAVVAGWGLVQLLLWASSKLGRRWLFPRGIPWLVAGLAVAGSAWFSMRTLRSNVEDKLSYAAGLRHAHAALGRELFRARESVTPHRVALLDVGAVGYYSGWSVVDTFGLNDAHVARHGRDDWRYVLSREPSAIVFISAKPDEFIPVFHYEERLHRASLEAGYRQRRTWTFVPGYHLLLFSRTEFGPSVAGSWP